jgi:hypothetical protein
LLTRPGRTAALADRTTPDLTTPSRNPAGDDGRPAVEDVTPGPPSWTALAAELEGLRHKLATQPEIEQAKGMLMGYYGCSAEDAFAALVRCSQHANRKLRDIAHDVVTAASRPGAHPYEALRHRLDDLPLEPLDRRPATGARN